MFITEECLSSSRGYFGMLGMLEGFYLKCHCYLMDLIMHFQWAEVVEKGREVIWI